MTEKKRRHERKMRIRIEEKKGRQQRRGKNDIVRVSPHTTAVLLIKKRSERERDCWKGE
jgi:hypothetical protein